MKRDLTIDACKGLGIILMVIGHSGCPVLLSDVIYLFHMPLFFFMSGMVFKEKYLADKKRFVFRKMKGLYLPYIKYGLLFLLLHNLFVFWGFYDDTRSDLGSFTLQMAIDNFMRLMTMRYADQLIGGFWFLKVLLIASVISMFALYVGSIILRNYSYSASAQAILVLLGMLFLSALSIWIDLEYKNFLASFYFIIGYWFSRIRDKLDFKFSQLPLLLAVVLILAAILCPMSMDDANKTVVNLLYYIVISVVGILASYLMLSSGIFSKIKPFLVTCGRYSLVILAFHFVLFKVVSLIKIYHLGLGMDSLIDFPVIQESNTFYWLLYSVVGILLSLCIGFGADFMKNKVVNKDA